MSAALLSLVVVTALLLTTATACARGAPASGPQYGLALPTWQKDGYDGPLADRYVQQVAATGARWVQVAPTWYQASGDASRIGPTDSTASDQGVERIIRLAHTHRLKVLLKPHVDMTGADGRTRFTPGDRPAWFASFRTFITHYARIARHLHVEEFAVGTELTGVTQDRAPWLKIISAVRADYSGSLVYAASTDELTSVSFWDAVDLIGADAYWPLAQRPTSDPAAMEAAWKPILRRLETLSARTHRRVLFTEAGYPSQRGAVTAPGSWTTSSIPDQAEQAAAYQALLVTFTGRAWWAGVFWWVWGVLPDESPSTRQLGYAVQGKEAATVLRKWWS